MPGASTKKIKYIGTELTNNAHIFCAQLTNEKVDFFSQLTLSVSTAIILSVDAWRQKLTVAIVSLQSKETNAKRERIRQE